jgi:hypothetical protein
MTNPVEPKTQGSSISGPYEAHALRFCSIYLSYGNQPMINRLYDYLVATYGIENAPLINKKVASAFASAKRTANLALNELESGLEVTLGPGMRHLHPNCFNDLGYHILMTDENLLHCMTDNNSNYHNCLHDYIRDCLEHPMMCRNPKAVNLTGEDEANDDEQEETAKQKTPPKKNARKVKETTLNDGESREAGEREEDDAIIPPPPAANISVSKTSLRSLAAGQVEQPTIVTPTNGNKRKSTGEPDEVTPKKKGRPKGKKK